VAVSWEIWPPRHAAGAGVREVEDNAMLWEFSLEAHSSLGRAKLCWSLFDTAERCVFS